MELVENKIQEKNKTFSWYGEFFPQITVCAVIFGLYFRNATFLFSFLNDGVRNAISISIKVGIVLWFLLGLPAIIKNIRPISFVPLFSIGAVIFIQYFFFSANNEYFVSTLKTFVTTILPCIICLLVIKDYDSFFIKIIKTGFVISGINVFHLAITIFGISHVSGYSMGFGNAMILPTNIMILCFLNKEHNDPFIPFVLGACDFVSVVLMGSRGALLGIIFFGFILFFNKFRFEKRKYGFYFFGLIALGIIIIVFYKPILTKVAEILNALGINSRSITMLLEDNILKDDGRSFIWSTVWDAFSKNPFEINGINADMMLNTGKFSNYSHNLYLELLYSFGILIGGFLCILFTCMFIRTSIFNFDSRSKISALFMCTFFPVCIVTGSLWTETSCWLWLFSRKYPVNLNLKISRIENEK